MQTHRERERDNGHYHHEHDRDGGGEHQGLRVVSRRNHTYANYTVITAPLDNVVVTVEATVVVVVGVVVALGLHACRTLTRIITSKKTKEEEGK